MGVIGSSGGGYATVNPTQGDPIGQALQNVENSAFKYNAQRTADEKTRQDAEQERRNTRSKEIEASDKYKKDNPFIATGITDVDSQNRASLENAMNARNEAVNNYSSTGDQKYKAVIAKIDSGVNEMKTFGDAYNNHVKSVTDGTADGTFNINSAKVKATGIDETHGKIVRRFDTEGNSVFDVFKTDDEGVVSLVKQGLNSKQLIDYNTPVKAFHIDGLNSPPGFKGKTLVDAFNVNVNVDKPLTEYISSGLNRKKRTYNPNAPKVAKTMAETSVNSKDNLYELFTRMNIDAENPDNYNENNKTLAKNYLEKLLLENSPDVTIEDPDIALLNYNRGVSNDARAQRNSDRDFNKKNKGKQTVVKEVIRDEYGELVLDKNGNTIETTRTSTTTDIPNNETGKTSAPAKAKTTNARKEISRSEISAKAKAFDVNAFYKNHKKK